MLNHTLLTLEIFSPNLSTPIIRPVEAEISSDAVEISDSSFFGLDGLPVQVVAAEFDVLGSTLSYRVIRTNPGTFSNVNDTTGFNGFAMSLSACAPGSGISIRAVSLNQAATTLGVTTSDITFDRDTLFVNVDGLPFQFNDRIEVTLSFRILGTSDDDTKLGGGTGQDKIYGQNGNDRVLGRDGSDWLYGGTGRDALVGSIGNDRLYGGDGPDVLRGDEGKDILRGGGGGDTLFGGAGADVFILETGGNQDDVMDFQPGLDQIRDMTGATSFADYEIFADERGWVTVQFGTVAFFVHDVTVEDLTADSFIF